MAFPARPSRRHDNHTVIIPPFTQKLCELIKPVDKKDVAPVSRTILQADKQSKECFTNPALPLPVKASSTRLPEPQADHRRGDRLNTAPKADKFDDYDNISIATTDTQKLIDMLREPDFDELEGGSGDSVFESAPRRDIPTSRKVSSRNLVPKNSSRVLHVPVEKASKVHAQKGSSTFILNEKGSPRKADAVSQRPEAKQSHTQLPAIAHIGRIGDERNEAKRKKRRPIIKSGFVEDSSDDGSERKILTPKSSITKKASKSTLKKQPQADHVEPPSPGRSQVGFSLPPANEVDHLLNPSQHSSNRTKDARKSTGLNKAILLQCKDKEVSVNRSLLYSCAKIDSSTTKLDLSTVHSEDMNVVLRFITLGELNVNILNFLAVREATDLLGVCELPDILKEFHEKIFKASNIVTILTTAQNKSRPDLFLYAWNLMVSQFHQHIASNHFLHWELRWVIALLSSNDIPIKSEVEVLDAGRKWLIAKPSERTKHLRIVFSCVRWFHMTEAEIAECSNVDKDLMNRSDIRELIHDAEWTRVVLNSGLPWRDLTLGKDRTKKTAMKRNGQFKVDDEAASDAGVGNLLELRPAPRLRSSIAQLENTHHPTDTSLGFSDSGGDGL